MKLYPSPFIIGDRFEFENKHGRAVLEAVSLPISTKNIRAIDAPKECLVTLDQIEQIALITDQVRLYPVVNWMEGATHCAFCRNSTTSDMGWLKVIELDYKRKIPAQEQIDRDMRGGRNRILI